MPFQDLDDYLDPTLKLPIGGKLYSVNSPSARTGIQVNGLVAAARAVQAGEDIAASDLAALSLDDSEERDFFRSLLGSTMEEMLQDGVGWHQVRHAGLTTMFWVTRGRAAAETFWQSGGDNPKAPTPAAPKKPKGKKRRTPAGRPASPGSSTPPSEDTTSPGVGSSVTTGS